MKYKIDMEHMSNLENELFINTLNQMRHKVKMAGIEVKGIAEKMIKKAGIGTPGIAGLERDIGSAIEAFFENPMVQKRIFEQIIDEITTKLSNVKLTEAQKKEGGSNIYYP